MPVKKFIFKCIMFFRWIYVHLFAWIFYNKKYLSGRWFKDGVASLGWQWAYRDIRFRFHSLKHLTIPWPVAPENEVGPDISFHPDDLNNMNSFGCYFQTLDGHISIGKGSYIGPNVGLITTSHDPDNLDEHLPGKDVILGEECWIGMNSVILPGVKLGDKTIVGAGSVVNKSFEEGHCLIAGSPARKIKDI